MTAVIELEGPRPSGGRRLQGALMAACVLMLAVGLVGLAVVGSDAASPVKELARLQEFVREARTARFTSDERSVESTGEGDVGSDYSSRSKVVGALQIPDRSQWTIDAGDYAVESIVVPGASYYREADSVVELADEQWVYEKDRGDEGDGPVIAGEMMAMAGGVASSFAADELLDLLAAAKTPERIDADTIEADVDVRKLPGFDPDDFVDPETETEKRLPPPTITIRLTSGDDHELVRMLVTTTYDGRDSFLGTGDDEGAPTTSTATSDIRFSDWGAPQSITAPAPSSVDPTPYVDEEAIAEFDAMPLFGLRALPPGFELLHADVYLSEADADEESGDCPEVDLSYGNAAEQDAAEAKATQTDDWDDVEFPETIDVELTPAACDYYGALAEDDGDPIRLGRSTGRIVRGEDLDEEYRTSIEIIVGATRINVLSDGPEAETVAAAADLVPLDLGTQPVHHEAPPD